MCKALIYTVNSASTAATLNAPVEIGSIIHKYGCAIHSDSSSFRITDSGYYDIDVSATFTAAVPGDVTLNVYSNGVLIPGATATETVTTANTEIRSVHFSATTKLNCWRDTKMLTIVATGTAPTITNIAVQIERE